jgi:NAD(P)H dehydrogenase (quinone)
MMKCLVVTAHPLSECLCAFLSQEVAGALKSGGHDVIIEDLYQSRFEPALTPAERQSYYSRRYDDSAVKNHTQRLLETEALVLVFPTWWFGFPAILKGWFDRVWGPGIAYDHAGDFGPIKPRLNNLKRLLAITTLGAPGWVDCLIMRRPLRRILKTAILSACAPDCKFEMLSLYKCEKLKPEAVHNFAQRIANAIGKW